ncbi:MAG: serine acetyltransferase [Thermoguttaceae bacterium]|nr:serine acetyltransferase [Thermoguttaceae bacterium]
MSSEIPLSGFQPAKPGPKRHQALLAELAGKLCRSYIDVPSTHHLGHCPLPNRQVIAEVIADLFEILYPGFQRLDRLNFDNILDLVGDTFERLCETLSVQFSRAFCHGRRQDTHCTPERMDALLEAGREKVFAFFALLPEIRRQLALDVEAAYVGDPACKGPEEFLICYPGLIAITVYRLAHALLELNIPLIPRMMTEWAHSRTGIDIHPGAKIGHHFFIDHGTGVVIGETCQIGSWVKLYQGVTLGALSFPKDEHGMLERGTKRHPTLGDNVVVYANATILGGQTVIGSGSVIGSSVWLVHSVGENTTVMIEKPKLVVRSGDKPLA